jgi:hypothetical protein
MVGDERVGTDELGRTVQWLHDRGVIDGPKIDEVPYPVKLCLTRAGRLVVAEQDGWVLAPAAAQSGPTPTAKLSISAISEAFLRWLFEHHHEQPPPGRFLDDPQSFIDGHQVDVDELDRAVMLLAARRLVAGPMAWGSKIPVRIKLTDAGLICVAEQDTDPSENTPVRTWGEVAQGAPVIDQRVSVNGNNNRVIAHTNGASQAETMDPGQRPDFSVTSGASRNVGHEVHVRWPAVRSGST